MTRSCKRVFVQQGRFIFDKILICIYINIQIPFRDFFLSHQHHISEHTLKWDQQQINKYRTQ